MVPPPLVPRRLCVLRVRLCVCRHGINHLAWMVVCFSFWRSCIVMALPGIMADGAERVCVWVMCVFVRVRECACVCRPCVSVARVNHPMLWPPSPRSSSFPPTQGASPSSGSGPNSRTNCRHQHGTAYGRDERSIPAAWPGMCRSPGPVCRCARACVCVSVHVRVFE